MAIWPDQRSRADREEAKAELQANFKKWLVGETLGSKRVVTEELTEQQKRAFEAIKASLHRMATKVLEAPRSEREAAYEIVSKSILKWRPPEFNVGDDEAVDFEAKYMSWLRALVSHIERSGGERGGTA